LLIGSIAADTAGETTRKAKIAKFSPAEQNAEQGQMHC